MTGFLEPELTTIALCWRLERRDGVAMGFTTHDRDLMVDGLAYRSAPGLLPAAVSTSDGFALDTLEIEGAVTGDAISAADLKAGRWDGASIRLFMTDWTAPGAEILPVARGELGEIAVKGDAFEAEVRGPTAALDAAVAEQTSPECRAMVGDRRCRIDMAGRVRSTRISAVVEDDVVEVEAAASGNAYGFGRLRWIGGANSGLESAVLASAGARLTLREPPPFAPAAGDLVEIVEGCDKSLATCAARFANAANFRGEPHLPGIDLLTRYPGA